MGKFLAGLLLGIILVPAVLLIIFVTGYFPVAATGHAPEWETKLAQFVLARAIVRQAPPLKNPLQPTQENLLIGLKVFHEACDGCHGTANDRSRWGTTDFYPRVPQFGFEGLALPDWQIFWVAKNGIRYTGMGGYSPDMSDDHAWAVALFLSRLNSLPPDVAAKWHQRNRFALPRFLSSEKLSALGLLYMSCASITGHSDFISSLPTIGPEP